MAWPSFFRLLDDEIKAGRRCRADLAPADLLRPEIVLTFDDGTADHLRVAELADLRAILFVSAGRLGPDAMLRPEDLRHIDLLGHVVGSHGLDHVPLDQLPPGGVSRELAESKERLESRAWTCLHAGRIDCPGACRGTRLRRRSALAYHRRTIEHAGWSAVWLDLSSRGSAAAFVLRA